MTSNATAPPVSFVLAVSAVSSLGAFAIDLSLPSMPQIGSEFDAAPWITQFTLTGYLLMLGLGQFVAGPLSDAVGRRRPQIVGLSLFVVASIVAAIAPSMTVLIAARVLQGAMGAVTFVVAMSSVADHTTGEATTRLYATLNMIAMTAPIVAPALGGVIDQMLGWRAVFACLAVLGLGTLAVAGAALPETLSPALRAAAGSGSALNGFGRLLKAPDFTIPWCALTAALVFLFCYVGGASYVYQGHYGINQAQFGVVFGVTGSAAMIGAVIAHVLAMRIGTTKLATLGAGVLVSGTAASLSGAWLGLSLTIVALGVGIGLLGLSLMEPALMSMCMGAAHGKLGAASALVGGAPFLLGAAVTAAISGVAARGPLPWTIPMLCTGLVSAALTFVACARFRRPC